MGVIANFLDRVVASSDFDFADVALSALQPEPPAEVDTTDHAEPFVPSLLDEAEEAGYQHGLADAYPSPDRRWPDAARLRYALGRQRGAREREARAAYDLGYALGLETGQSEPPAGMLEREKAAYREGFRAAQDEYEAWLDRMAREREEELMLEDGQGWDPIETIEAAGVLELRRGAR